ncbi:SPOR domain-containing protein [Marinirhabdus gelatinilytica]|uniref:Sporulation related protein n=1 Tax=Marinirhabdus gelatinilytica TaxID=1703343 RepID=A0A370QII8_9FLAO|nr:SPOR domain-containing protein [Marinirhabdus gelatinilytica]RDK88177.1 sporulation related protein [Marinirhabdus gelatinilytica]
MKKQHTLNIFIFSILLVFAITDVVGQQATVTVNQDAKIPELLDLKKELEKDNKLGQGFTIQLYYGELSQANSVLRKYKANFAAWPASLEYETPNYKIWAGDFATRLEADRALLEIKEKFPAAFILKPSK